MARPPASLFAAAAMLSCATALAQAPPPAPPGRFEATVLAGYRIEGSISTKAAPDVPVLDLANAATYGLALDWRLDRWADAEFQYSFTNSPATSIVVDPTTGSIVRGQTYDMGVHDVTFGLIVSVLAAGKPVRPYLGLGLGFTVLVPNNEFSSETKFTFSVAGGVRAYTSDHFGLRFEARWAPVYLFSTGPGGYNCDPLYFVCSSRDTGHVIQQADFRLGAIFRF
ncbi:MAG: outer membrane beta-barrel protein [Syntrophomonadaceae bacterium]